MQITLYGVNYTTRPNTITSNFIKMLNDDDTIVLYVTSNKKQIDDFDVILLINIERREAFPMFLSVFNELVEPYYVPVIKAFPEVRIIESSAVDYMICSISSLSVIPKYTDNNYIAYCTVGKTLYVCPNKKIEFSRFGTAKIESSESVSMSERIMLHEHEVVNRPVKEEPRRSQLYRPTQHQVQKPAQPTPIPGHRPVEKPVKKMPEVKVPEKQHTNGPSRENLFKYCGYVDGMIVIHLVYNNELAFIDKKTGSIKIFNIDDIIANSIIGYDDATFMLRQFGKVVTMVHDVESINLTDIRSAIRMFESKKDTPVTKQMMAYNNKQLYISLASEKAVSEQVSIKNFTIACHRESQVLYEKLKEKTMTYSKDVYFVVTNTDCGIIVASSDPKKPEPLQYILLEKVYECTDAQNIGDIMRMFPVEKIVDGVALGIEAVANIKTMNHVSDDVLKLVAHKYEIRNVIYSYDARSQSLMRN